MEYESILATAESEVRDMLDDLNYHLEELPLSSESLMILTTLVSKFFDEMVSNHISDIDDDLFDDDDDLLDDDDLFDGDY